jgi:hypothetical protein
VADAAVSPPLGPDDEHDETPKSATANTNAGRVTWLMDPPDDRLDRDINEANQL